jgi:hypothetical protein
VDRQRGPGPKLLLAEAEACPSAGNSRRAAPFRTNTVASDAEVSWSSACSTGAAAAMALPPQIAFPTVIRAPVAPRRRSERASRYPTPIDAEMLTTVYPNPRTPARATAIRFMPAPSPTTAAGRSFLTG